MTNTVQPNSTFILGKTDGNLTVNDGQTENDDSLLLSVYNSLNNLSMSLNKMDNVQHKLFEKLILLERIVHNI